MTYPKEYQLMFEAHEAIHKALIVVERYKEFVDLCPVSVNDWHRNKAREMKIHVTKAFEV